MVDLPATFPTGIAPPGTCFGPCVGRCEHASCGTMRDQAAENCTGCTVPIGYEKPFVDNGPGHGCTCGKCLDAQADQHRHPTHHDGAQAT